MIRYLLWRLVQIIVILLGATLVAFLLMHAIPGNPWSNYSDQQRIIFNMSADKSFEREITRRFGLGLPLWQQYTRYFIGDFQSEGHFSCGAICGNLGPSIQLRGRTVQDILFTPPRGMSIWRSQFGYSIRLVLSGALIAAMFGIILGMISARKPRSKLSRAISFMLALLMSIPNFVLGLLAMIVLGSWLKVIKVVPDWNNWTHWIIPALVLAVAPMAGMARITHAALVNVVSEDYVRTARAKGLPESRVFIKHVFRTALIPILSFLGPMSIDLFAGLFIIENMYAFPGFGRQYWISVLQLDYPVVVGLTFFLAAVVALVNLGIDLLSAALDPRIRSGIQRGESW